MTWRWLTDGTGKCVTLLRNTNTLIGNGTFANFLLWRLIFILTLHPLGKLKLFTKACVENSINGDDVFHSIASTCRSGIDMSSKGILSVHSSPDTLTYAAHELHPIVLNTCTYTLVMISLCMEIFLSIIHLNFKLKI